MSKKLFVGSLPYEATVSDVEELFSKVGGVESVNLITDKFTGQSKGFAFVEMNSDDDAKKAITDLNNTNFQNRKIIVSEARPQKDRNNRGFDNAGPRRGGFQRTKRW